MKLQYIGPFFLLLDPSRPINDQNPQYFPVAVETNCRLSTPRMSSGWTEAEEM